MSVIGKRYAEGLALVAQEQNHLRDYLRELKLILSVANSSEAFSDFFNSPQYVDACKKSAFDELFADEISETVKNFVFLLIDTGRITYFSDVVEEYRQIANHMEKVVHVDIYTPFPLTDDEVEQIANKAKERAHASDIRTETVIDPSVRGGVIIRVGDYKYDFSLRGALETLKKQLAGK